MPDYLYDENIAHFERLVADSMANSSRDEKRHAMLLRLLAEEKAKRDNSNKASAFTRNSD